MLRKKKKNEKHFASNDSINKNYNDYNELQQKYAPQKKTKNCFMF